MTIGWLVSSPFPGLIGLGGIPGSWRECGCESSQQGLGRRGPPAAVRGPHHPIPSVQAHLEPGASEERTVPTDSLVLLISASPMPSRGTSGVEQAQAQYMLKE